MISVVNHYINVSRWHYW